VITSTSRKEFEKVEQFVICKADPEGSAHWHGQLFKKPE